MITDATYYTIGGLKIPNAVNGNAGAPNNALASDLDFIIVKYERPLLIGAIGGKRYLELESAMEDLENADEKWKNLVNGTNYEKDGLTFIWDGLRGDNKDSFVANYVYCHYLRFDEIQYSSTGMTILGVKNGDNASFLPKYVSSWNSFLRGYQGEGANPVSLEKFLADHESDYPLDGHVFKKHSPVNRFGI